MAVFTPFGVRGGLLCLAGQCIFYLLLRYIDTVPSMAGPWSRRAGFTAHQIVTLPVLSYLTFEGLYLWFFESSTSDDMSPHFRLIGEHAHSQHLTEFVAGMMFFWYVSALFFTCKQIRHNHRLTCIELSPSFPFFFPFFNYEKGYPNRAFDQGITTTSYGSAPFGNVCYCCSCVGPI